MSLNDKVIALTEKSGRHRSTNYRELKRNEPGPPYMFASSWIGQKMVPSS